MKVYEHTNANFLDILMSNFVSNEYFKYLSLKCFNANYSILSGNMSRNYLIHGFI